MVEFLLVLAEFLIPYILLLLYLSYFVSSPNVHELVNEYFFFLGLTCLLNKSKTKT